MKYGLAIVLALLAQPLSAQQTDTVEITIYDQGDVRVQVTPLNYRGFKDDTLTFTAVVIDTITGDTLDAQLQWFTDSPSNVQIDAETGHATFLNRGQYQVWAEVLRFTGFAMFRQPLDAGPVAFTEFMTVERAAYFGVPADVNELIGPSCQTWNDDGVPDQSDGWLLKPTCSARNDDGARAKFCSYLVLEDIVVEKSDASCPNAVLGNSDPLPSYGAAFRSYLNQRLGVMVGS